MLDPFTMMLLGGGAQGLMGMLGAGAAGEEAQRKAQQQKDSIDWNNHIQNCRLLRRTDRLLSLILLSG